MDDMTAGKVANKRYTTIKPHIVLPRRLWAEVRRLATIRGCRAEEIVAEILREGVEKRRGEQE